MLLATFIATNDIIKLKHLRFADHPRSWFGADQFSAVELAFVWGLKSTARMRSRLSGCSCSCVSGTPIAVCVRSRPIQRQLSNAAGLELLDQRRPPNTTAAGLGPMAALKTLQVHSSPSEKQAWLEESRLDAILGATACSQKSVRSGVRCWMSFVGSCILGFLSAWANVLPCGCAQTTLTP